MNAHMIDWRLVGAFAAGVVMGVWLSASVVVWGIGKIRQAMREGGIEIDGP